MDRSLSELERRVRQDPQNISLKRQLLSATERAGLAKPFYICNANFHDIIQQFELLAFVFFMVPSGLICSFGFSAQVYGSGIIEVRYNGELIRTHGFSTDKYDDVMCCGVIESVARARLSVVCKPLVRASVLNADFLVNYVR